ncbi:hypothetical protein EIP91_008944 [Steccherinum ochraceum]|uniref:SAM domain-containing protein n=1 Tax=Steccherinum ochraceum TaxID=92696 RepID=A0A4R0RVB4_9APHY|nr:hypothetical protein EIP91_008944 [Steccherinum ochraceum]
MDASQTQLWKRRLAEYLQCDTGSARRKYRYELAMDLDITEGTVRRYLQRVNGNKPIPPLPSHMQIQPGARPNHRPRVAEGGSFSVSPRCSSSQRALVLPARKKTPVFVKLESDSASEAISKVPHTKSTPSRVFTSGRGTSPIDLCSDSEEDNSEMVVDAAAPALPCDSKDVDDGEDTGTSPPPRSSEETPPDSEAQPDSMTVAQFLTQLGVPDLIPIFHDHSYITPDDLHTLRFCAPLGRDRIMDMILEDGEGRIKISDWNELYVVIMDRDGSLD